MNEKHSVLLLVGILLSAMLPAIRFASEADVRFVSDWWVHSRYTRYILNLMIDCMTDFGNTRGALVPIVRFFRFLLWVYRKPNSCRIYHAAWHAIYTP